MVVEARDARRAEVGEGGLGAVNLARAVGNCAAAAGELGREEVADQCAGGGDERVAVIEAEPGEGGDLEELEECLARFGGAEVPLRLGCGGDRQGREGGGEAGGRLAGGGLGVEKLGHAAAGELVGDLVGLDVQDVELAGGEFRDGEGGGAGGERGGAGVFAVSWGGCCFRREADGGEDVGGVVVEQVLVDERAGGEDGGDAALDDGVLGFGFRGVFQLVADGDAEAGVDQLAGVGVELVVGDAGHGDAGGALGEGEADRLGCGDGVVVEHLVEVAHAEHEQAVGVRLFELGVLPHCRGVAGVVGHRFGMVVDGAQKWRDRQAFPMKNARRGPGVLRGKWSGGESNSRPRHCERRALPTELPPRFLDGRSIAARGPGASLTEVGERRKASGEC